MDTYIKKVAASSPIMGVQELRDRLIGAVILYREGIPFGYGSLQDAVAESKDDDRVVLYSDITITAAIALKTSITIDTNGFTITHNLDGSSMFVITASNTKIIGGGVLRLTGGSGGLIVESIIDMAAAAQVDICCDLSNERTGLSAAISCRSEDSDTMVNIIGSIYSSGSYGIYSEGVVTILNMNGNIGGTDGVGLYGTFAQSAFTGKISMTQGQCAYFLGDGNGIIMAGEFTTNSIESVAIFINGSGPITIAGIVRGGIPINIELADAEPTLLNCTLVRSAAGDSIALGCLAASVRILGSCQANTAVAGDITLLAGTVANGRFLVSADVSA